MALQIDQLADVKKPTLQEHPRWHRASSVALFCYSLTSSPTGVNARGTDAALASLAKAASPWLLCVVERVLQTATSRKATQRCTRKEYKKPTESRIKSS